MDRITSSVSQKLFGANRKAISPKSHPANFMDLPPGFHVLTMLKETVKLGACLGQMISVGVIYLWAGSGFWHILQMGSAPFFSGGYKFLYVCELNKYIYLPSMMQYTNAPRRTSHLKLLRWCMMVHGGSMKLLIYYKHIYIYMCKKQIRN